MPAFQQQQQQQQQSVRPSVKQLSFSFFGAADICELRKLAAVFPNAADINVNGLTVRTVAFAAAHLAAAFQRAERIRLSASYVPAMVVADAQAASRQQQQHSQSHQHHDRLAFMRRTISMLDPFFGEE